MYWPDVQLEHDAAPVVDAIVPGEHGVHAVAVADAELNPIGHARHCSACADAENLPDPHGWHEA